MFNFFDSIYESEFKQSSLEVAYHQFSASILSRLNKLALKIERSGVCNYDFAVAVSYAEVRASSDSSVWFPSEHRSTRNARSLRA